MQITINQHYVPRFYMKFFSNIINANSKREKVLISFYQFKDDLYRKDVPTNSICSEDYFYDKDGSIENALANKEGIWGTALRNANDNTYTLADLENIREFVIYQIIRTKAMLSHNRSMATNMMKCVIKKKFGDVANEDEVNEFLSNKIQNEITPELGLSIAQEMIPVISDLKMKIITNETQMRFISSDAPVIIINPLGIYSAGLSFVGEVIFFPISPWKMIFLYDDKMFGSLPVNITDKNIVEILNRYQYVSADERLLAKDVVDIKDFVNNSELDSKRTQFCNMQKTKVMQEGSETIIAAKSRSIPYYFNIPILSLPKTLRKIPIDYRETFPRDYSYEKRLEILCRIYRDPDFIQEKEHKDSWKKQQTYSKILLNYLDNYWNTPMQDRVLTPELMKKLKTVPVNTFYTQND